MSRSINTHWVVKLSKIGNKSKKSFVIKKNNELTISTEKSKKIKKNITRSERGRERYPNYYKPGRDFHKIFFFVTRIYISARCFNWMLKGWKVLAREKVLVSQLFVPIHSSDNVSAWTSESEVAFKQKQRATPPVRRTLRAEYLAEPLCRSRFLPLPSLPRWETMFSFHPRGPWH